MSVDCVELRIDWSRMTGQRELQLACQFCPKTHAGLRSYHERASRATAIRGRPTRIQALLKACLFTLAALVDGLMPGSAVQYKP